MRMRPNGFEQLESEILAEQAAALGRIGRRLEADIAELLELRAEIRRPGAPVPALQERYRGLLREARRQLWVLMVQREALGFRRNDELAAIYRIPPPLSKSA